MKRKKLDEKLETMKAVLKQSFVVHIGIPERGEYDILGIECCGPSKNEALGPETQELVRGLMEPNKKSKKELAYIG